MESKINRKTFLIAGLLVLSSTFSGLFAGGVERYAIYIGSNKGGEGRTELLYAGSDAENIRKTMKEVGGINDKNSIMLVNPSEDDINSAISDITDLIRRNKKDSSRTEFIFYYSGHSDEDSLLLGTEHYSYSNLKSAITDIPSDIHVVILDSCYSGNFIRTKGGQKKKPFLMDDSSVVKGHAYLSSSSETEYSQESDEIEASYFTNAVVTGLRGAADSSGDKKVSLNELYSYAFNETLKKTEDSKSGPQHPNYNITLVGSGDLILSDFSESDSIISIGKDVVGKVVLRDSNGKLVSEIDKNDSTPVMLALPAGKYSVLLSNDTETMQGDVSLNRDDALVIGKKDLHKIETKQNTVRGNQVAQNTQINEDVDDQLHNVFNKLENGVRKVKNEVSESIDGHVGSSKSSKEIEKENKERKRRAEEAKKAAKKEKKESNKSSNKKNAFSKEYSDDVKDMPMDCHIDEKVLFGRSLKHASTPLPFDIEFLMDNSLSYSPDDAFYKHMFLSDSNDFVKKFDVSGTLRTAFVSDKNSEEAEFLGVDAYFVGTETGYFGYSIAPSIGMCVPKGSRFKGLYFNIAPYIFTGYSDSGIDNDWDWQFSVEVGSQNALSNFLVDFYAKALVDYSFASMEYESLDSKVALTFGIRFGLYMPSKRNCLYFYD